MQEVYFEFIPVGDAIKVSAIDGATGREVSIMGPVRANHKELERIALNKLRYVLEQEGKAPAKTSGVDKPVTKKDGGGWVV